MKMAKYISVVLSLFCTTMLFAQAITMNDLPYFCDFEDDTENAKWVLNPGIDQITTTNAWAVGNALAYTGEKSLYVSNDNGVSNLYDPTHNVLIAYRDVKLDAGYYDIAYDWKGMGNGTNGYLKVFCTSRRTQSISCLGNSVEPSWVTTPMVSGMDGKTMLNNGDAWQHVQARIQIPRQLAGTDDAHIFFVWVNNESPVKASNTTVAIDNFQMAKASPTGYPENIHVSTFMRTATVSWDGKADGYEILYRKKTEDTFRSVTTDTASVDLPIGERDYGAYEFWICGINGTDKTVYTIFPVVYIYRTDCFDALNMYNATFEYGSWKGVNATGVANKTVLGRDRVDFGFDDVRSRHTTHFDTTEIDPRTITRVGKDTISLHTVPSGEYGSVRIGNWNTGSQYESITFRYTVDSKSNALLLVRYAIVLENPNHGAADQPRFTLEIKDANGKSVDPKCGNVDFHAPTADEWRDPEIKELWHTTNGGSVNWQEWRTIGLNLEKYVGQELFLTFTSYDCDQGGHYGYAYFTLRCSRSDVDGEPWGQDAQAQEFTAPEGLNYAWFNVNDTQFKDTLSTERIFHVNAADTNKYVCHATYPTNPQCGFEFTACAKPHNPIAEIQYLWTPKDCTNSIYVRNASHVGLKNITTGEIEHDYTKQMEFAEWTMPDGTMSDSLFYNGFSVPIPNEGGTYTYKLRTGVYINDTVFIDSTVCTIVVPEVKPMDTYIDSTICYGQAVVFPWFLGEKRTESGEYIDSLVSPVTGCDSVLHLNLTVIEPLRTELYDTICFEQSREFNGTYYRQTGDYVHTISNCATTGCDSIITLHLVRAEQPHVILQNAHICGDEQLVFMANNSEWVDSFRVVIPGMVDSVFHARQSDMQWSIPPHLVRANRYTAQVVSYMSWCDAYTDTLSFNIDLSNQIVVTKFNDVFAILNEQHNGGYRFTSYQWYANGELIPGATGSNYHDPNMAHDTEYTVCVVLEDGTVLWICPFTYDGRTPVDNIGASSSPRTGTVMVVPLGARVAVSASEDAQYEWFTLTGQRVAAGQLRQGDTSVITPAETGWFLLRVHNDRSSMLQRVIII